MRSIKLGVRAAAVGAGAVVLGFGLFLLRGVLGGPPGLAPGGWDVFDLVTALSVGAVGAVCLWAGFTGKGEHMRETLERIDAASEAAALREARGLRRQREALELERRVRPASACSSRDPATRALCAVVLVVAGCESSPAPTDASIEFDVVDGVPTLTIEELWGSEWPLIPNLVIDTVIAPSDGDALGLMAPLHVAVLSDGRIVIGDAGTRQIWIGSDSGEWTPGPGPGPGPGEIRAIGGVWPAGDGFLVHDPGTGELARFDSTGQWIDREPVGSQYAVHGPGSSMGAWAPSLERLGEESWLVSVPATEDVQMDGAIWSAEARFVWVSGHPADREVPLGRGRLRPMFVEGGGGGPVPFGSSSYAAGAAGAAAIFRGSDASIEKLDAEGAVALRVRWTDDAPALGPSHHAAMGNFMRGMAPAESPEAMETMIAALSERIPLPERLPHLGALRLGEDGALWLGWPERSGLETPAEPELVRAWRVLLPGGDPGEAELFQASLPPGVTLLTPAPESERAGTPGWAGRIDRGDFLVLLRDEVGRQGIGLLRHGAGR